MSKQEQEHIKDWAKRESTYARQAWSYCEKNHEATGLADLTLISGYYRLGHFSSILPLTSSSEEESLPARLLAKTAPPHRTVSLRSEQHCRAELVLVGTSTVPQTPIWRHFMERSRVLLHSISFMADTYLCQTFHLDEYQ